MSPSNWTRLRAVLERASELEGAQRDAYLDRECAGDAELRREADELLAADSRAGRLEPPDPAVVSRAMGSESDAAARVGPWKLERKLGSGGMGAVWLGHRVDGGFAQRVAIKLIKRGMDTEDILRRFERERALLAELEHPSIARLYDGGSTGDGRPYLVMEFVDGVPFDEYCARADVTLQRKLELFARICDAVEHAHERRVVHRDLKPQNVLVTADGSPKLLDFGIAKVLASEDGTLATRTATEHRILTPHYASPEQLRGDAVTARSDVFALGVMLYEAISGERPFDPTRTADSEAAPAERAARARGLAGELDTIVRKALQVEPARRYESAAALAADVRRYLAGEPVRARPDTWSYRTSKFVRRNRLLVAATATVIAALSIGLVVAWNQYGHAENARAVADQRLKSVLRLASSFSSKLSGRLGAIEGILPQREALLRDMNAQLEELANEVPDDRSLAVELAWSRRELALVLGLPTGPSLSKFDDAQTLIDRALADLEPWLASNPRDIATACAASALLTSCGELHQYRARYDAARADLQRALDVARTAHEGVSGDRELNLLMRECTALHDLLGVDRDAHTRDSEAAHADEYFRLVERACQDHPESNDFRYWLATSLISRASSAVERAEYEPAVADFERAVASIELLSQRDPDNALYRRALAAARYYQADVFDRTNQPARAVEVAERAWNDWEDVVRREPQDTRARDSIVNYAYSAGSIARKAKRLDVARRALERTLEAIDDRLARRPEQRSLAVTWATAGTELAAALAESGEWKKALELAQKAIARGLELDEAARGYEWKYGMSLSYANAAECNVFVARDSDGSAAERRAQIAASRDALERGRAMLKDARDRGELGADELEHFAYMDGIEKQASEVLATLPEN